MTKGGRGRAPRQRRDTREKEGEHHASRTERATAGREDRDSNLGDDPRVGVVNSADVNSNGRDGVGSGDRDTREEGQDERELAKIKYQNKVELLIRLDARQEFLQEAYVELMRQMDDKDLIAFFTAGLIPGDAARVQVLSLVHQFRLAYPQPAPVAPPTLKERCITFSRALDKRTLNFLGEVPHDFRCRKRWNFGNRHLESFMLHLDLSERNKAVVYVMGQIPGSGKTSLCLFAASQFDRMQKGVEGAEKFKEALQSFELSEAAQKEKTSIFYVELEKRDTTAGKVHNRMIAVAYGDNGGDWETLVKELSGRGKSERLIVVIDEFQHVTDDGEIRTFFGDITEVAKHCIFIVAGASVQMITAMQHNRVSMGSGVELVIPLVLPPIKVSDWKDILKTTNAQPKVQSTPSDLSQASQPETLAKALLRAELGLQPGDKIEEEIFKKHQVSEDRFLESVVNRIVGETGGLPTQVVESVKNILGNPNAQYGTKYSGFPDEENVKQLEEDVVRLVTFTMLRPDLSAREIVVAVFDESVFNPNSNESMRQRAANAILLSGVEIQRQSGPDFDCRFYAGLNRLDIDEKKLGVSFVLFEDLSTCRFVLTPYSYYRAAAATIRGRKIGYFDPNLTSNKAEMTLLGILKWCLEDVNNKTLVQLFPKFEGHPRAHEKVVSQGVDMFAGAKVWKDPETGLTVGEMLELLHHRTESDMNKRFTPFGKAVSPEVTRQFLNDLCAKLVKILMYVPGEMSHSADIIVLMKLESGTVIEIHFQVKGLFEYRNLTDSDIIKEHEKSEKSSNNGSISVIVIFNHIRPCGDNVRTTAYADKDRLTAINHEDGRTTYRAVARGLNNTEILEQFIKTDDFVSLVKRGRESVDQQIPTALVLKTQRHS